MSSGSIRIPVPDENVSIEYLNIDEIEAVCWLPVYCKKAYMDNVNMKLTLSDIGKKEIGQIKFVDVETGRIELKCFRS